MKQFHMLNMLVCILALIVLIVDYYFIHEFQMEGIFLLTSVTVLGLNVVRHSNRRLWGKLTPGLMINAIITALLVYGFYTLFLFLFGYGFTGRYVQPIWITMAICSFTLFILTFMDVHYLQKKQKRGAG